MRISVFRWTILLFTLVLVAAMVGQMSENRDNFASNTSIPLTIWTYWHDGNAIPEVVQMCIQSWKCHNPDATIVVVTDNNLQTYLPAIPLAKLKQRFRTAHVSDRIRIALLERYGGIWMDASIACRQSLAWVLDAQKASQCEVVGFYLRGFTTKPSYPVIENWFLAAAPGSHVIKLWKAEMQRMDNFPSMDAYFENLKRRKIDLQNLGENHYLSMHVAAQVVFQTELSSSQLQKSLKLFPAEDTAFRYLEKNGWDAEKAFDVLCESADTVVQEAPFIKMRGSERSYLTEHKEKYACLQNVIGSQCTKQPKVK